MKKITDLKKLLCISVSAATVLSLGCLSMADETEELTEDIPEETEIISADSEEEIIEETVPEENFSEEDPEVYEVLDEEEYDEVLLIDEELSEDEMVETDLIEVEEISAGQNGWEKSESGLWYYYINGEKYKGWLEIKGKYYYLDADHGYMYRGLETINDKLYLFNEDGVMQTGFKQYNLDWYYFGKSGAAYKGWHKIDKKWYYFNKTNGKMYTGLMQVDGDYYFFGYDGSMKTGWQSRGYANNKSWYYFDSQGKAVKGWNKIGKKWYYFNESGSPYLYQDGVRQINDSYYCFDENGAMLTGWYNYGSDNYPSWLYLGSNGKAVTGWKKIGKSWYYFSETGYPSMTDYELIKIDGYYYSFKDNGKMRTGWYNTGSDKNPAWMYFGSDGKAYSGWNKINNKWYCFRDATNYTPTLYFDTVTKIGDHYYGFDENGVMRTGWFNNGDEDYPYWYYFKSNGAAASGWTKIGKKWYHFRNEDDYAPSLNTAQFITDDSGTYYVNENGVMLKNSWYHNEDNDDWYYLGSDGKAATGWKQINGKWYYFCDRENYLPYMFISTHTIDGYTYYFDPETGVMQTGWVNNGSAKYPYWYYYDSKGRQVQGWKKIDGNWYYFDFSMTRNTFVTLDGKTYYFKNNGVMATGFYKVDGQWYYARSGGACLKGEWEKINGKWYYFTGTGRMVTGYYTIGDTIYQFNSKGVCLNPYG